MTYTKMEDTIIGPSKTYTNLVRLFFIQGFCTKTRYLCRYLVFPLDILKTYSTDSDSLSSDSKEVLDKPPFILRRTPTDGTICCFLRVL